MNGDGDRGGAGRADVLCVLLHFSRNGVHRSGLGLLDLPPHRPFYSVPSLGRDVFGISG